MSVLNNDRIMNLTDNGLNVNYQFTNVNYQFTNVNYQFTNVNYQFTNVNYQFTNVNYQFTNVNYQFTNVKYTDYNECNSAYESDMPNHFTNIFPDSKYYLGNVFSTSSKPLTPGIFYSLECMWLELQLQRN